MLESDSYYRFAVNATQIVRLIISRVGIKYQTKVLRYAQIYS